jgi:electron-transferring-flavoprotein dehydrogenase
MPNWLLPPLMSNHGNYIVSLGNVCRWLAQQAERSASRSTRLSRAEVLYDDKGAVRGVATGDMGVARDGTHKPITSRDGAAREVHAVRGRLPRIAVEELMRKFNLRDGVDPQKYGIGIKELWEVRRKAQPGPRACTARAGRSIARTGGGSFLYHFGEPARRGRIRRASQLRESALFAVRRVPAVQDAPGDPRTFEGGKRLGYGARAINEGGLQSVPKLAFPAARCIGCSAGFVNLPRIKGSHNAMKSACSAPSRPSRRSARDARTTRCRPRRRLAQVMGLRGPLQGR